jgi:PAS domain S-box-containing protein
MRSAQPAALIALPARDLIFGTWANAMMERGSQTPDQLARWLLAAFPMVRVRVQHELAASHGDPIWYAFRDGVYRPAPSTEPWRSVDRTVAVVDDDGRFVDADGTTERTFGLDRASLLGRRLSDFCAPQDRDLADGLMALVEAARSIETRWLLYRPSAARAHVDFVLLHDEAGSHQTLAIVREVAADEMASRRRPEPPPAAEPATNRSPAMRARQRRGAAEPEAPLARAHGRQRPHTSPFLGE